MPLKGIMLDYENIQPRIEAVVKRVNCFVTLGYEFIKAYLLSKFEKNEPFPVIDRTFIRHIFNLISYRTHNNGVKCVIDKDLEKFYNDDFSKVSEKLLYDDLVYILSLTNEEMITCIETNIKEHFIKYLFRYVNKTIGEPNRKAVRSMTFATKEDMKKTLKEFNKELKDIKDDLISGKFEKSHPKYKPVVEQLIKDFIPPTFVENVAYDLEKDPQKYLPYAFLINKRMEDKKWKVFQVLPHRGCTLGHITLSTASLIEVIHDQKDPKTKKPFIYDFGLREMKTHIKKYQHHAWDKIFDLNNKKFIYPGYKFHHQIKTDGVTACILFIREDCVDHQRKGKMPIELEYKIKQLTDLSKNEMDSLIESKRKLVAVDPGKTDLITSVDNQGNFYSYSSARMRSESYTTRSREILNKEKKKAGIDILENQMKETPGKTYSFEKYMKYLAKKKLYQDKMNEFYQRLFHRKTALRRSIRKRGAQDRLLNEFKKVYRKDCFVGLGNWSNNCSSHLKGSAPSMNRGIHRLLSRVFEVVEVDEYRTSKTYNKDQSIELVKKKVKVGNKMRSIHKLLTPEEEPRGIVVNRDRNAALNILYVMEYHLALEMRPPGLQHE